MEYRLIISERADEQLDNIIKYVAEELQNKSAGSNKRQLTQMMADHIIECAELICTYKPDR